jgi:hypothetical protein
VTIRISEKKHLSAKGLLKTVRQCFSSIDIQKKGGSGKRPEIPLVDCLMSGLAVFNLKFPSLLQFDKGMEEEAVRYNLDTLFGVNKAPCDTQMRERLDQVPPKKMRSVFKKVFSSIQRGKVLEKYQFIDDHYLLLADGTGFFSSKSVHCENCCVKNHRNGTQTYYHQMLGAVIAHPDHKEVFPLCPEPISNTDGQTKNDCERNASKRLLEDVRREHPHLPLIVVEDGLASNAPHIMELKKHNMKYILGAKPGDHAYLFEQLETSIPAAYHEIKDEDGTLHQFNFLNNASINKSNSDLKVNIFEYRQTTKDGKEVNFSWITNIEITKDNVYQLMRGGRTRWKVENETFNTLKNQGYNFEHNYGHGKQHLCTIFGMLMMLAFLIDQVQQACCGLFQAAWKKCGAKIVLWEKIRVTFQIFKISSWVAYYEAIAEGFKGIASLDTS